MLGSRVFSNLYKSAKNATKSCADFIVNSPHWYRGRLIDLYEWWADFKYKLNNLGSTNLEVGLYHMHQYNLGDAKFRFKIVARYFKDLANEANYWLGWCCFLEGNFVKAIHHLKLAESFDTLNLSDFINNYQKLDLVPQTLWLEYRNFIAVFYVDRFRSSSIHIPYTIVHQTMMHITKLPNHYKVLEIGSNVGILGYEIRKRFQDTFTLTGIEESKTMVDVAHEYYPNIKIYDQLVEDSFDNFADNATDKFEIILSLCGISFTKNILTVLKTASKIIHDEGYFTFAVEAGKTTKYSKINKEFVFTEKDIESDVKKSDFTILTSMKIDINKEKQYLIFVLRKKSS